MNKKIKNARATKGAQFSAGFGSKDPKSAIKVDNLDFSYGKVRVINDLSFEIKEGDFVGIIGPNGSGKTTLVKILIGSLKKDSGSIVFFENEFNKVKDFMGYVPQKIDVDPTFPATVKELLNVVKNKVDFDEVIKIMEIEKLIDKKFSELSGGQQQRVLASLALAKNPKILILDEPSSGIDISGQTKFNDLLSKLNKKRNTTILLISHDTEIVSKYTNKALCIGEKYSCFGSTKNIKTYLSKVYGSDYKAFPHHHHHH
jgi:zinc transport system ATP-binding protein